MLKSKSVTAGGGWSRSPLLPRTGLTTTFNSPSQQHPTRVCHFLIGVLFLGWVATPSPWSGVAGKELQTKLAAAHQSEENFLSQTKFVYRNANSDCACWLNNRESITCRGKGCSHVPRNLSIPASGKLKIVGTEIAALRPGDFRGYEQLVDLQMDSNEIASIQPGTFQNLSHLLNLSMSFNHLTTLQPTVFIGLVNLKWLRLSKNSFVNLSEIVHTLIPDILPNLKQLNLAENAFGKIDQEDFYQLRSSKLESLDLSNCALTTIHPRALLPLKALTRLVLKENTMENGTLADLVSVLKNSSLQILDISRSGFTGHPPRRLMEVLAGSNVTELNLAFNTLTQLNNRTFPFMPKIRTLNLYQCGIYVIANSTFSALPNLRVLNLGKNTLVGIPKAILSTLPHLEVLDLSGNSRGREEEEEGGSTAGGEFELADRNFQLSTRLKYLDLSHTNVGIVSVSAFQGLSSLVALDLGNCSIYRLDPLAFTWLTSLEVLRMEGNPFEYQNFSRKTFQGLRQLQRLYLDNCRIANFSEDGVFAEMPRLVFVSLRQNHLTTLDANPFWRATSLQVVDLSQNFLRAWEERVFEYSPNLQALVLNDNKISTVTTAMGLDFGNLSRVELSDNPMDCDCHLSILRDMIWPLTNDSSEAEQDHTNASASGLRSINTEYCYSPDEWRLKRMVDFLKSLDATGSEATDCRDTVEGGGRSLYYYWGPIISVVVVLVLFAFIAVVGYKLRWYFRYWLFLLRLRRHRLRHSPSASSTTAATAAAAAEGSTTCPVQEDSYAYDAFVSYSNQDQAFVARVVSMLENAEPYFRLCVFERDFTAGTILNECILESIASSRKVILLLSDSFTRSQWCLWELHLAQHSLIEEQREGLILIKLGDLKTVNITPTLRYLMRTRIYLEWDDGADIQKQRLFWTRLRSALVRPAKQFSIPRIV